MILILSTDAVAAALLGALVETLGYTVRFAAPTENADQSIRRARPRVLLVDCADAEACSRELLGRATMRGVSVIMFGTTHALGRVREMVHEHQLDTLLMPPHAADLRDTLERAMKKAG
jgi:DNA-binding NtrC family response regulator